jgi:beta-lactamase regulating signal transducer with metallopeptidase domain
MMDPGLNLLVETVGEALLHFLWQGTFVAAALAVTVRLMRRRPAAERYLARCAALLAMAALPVATTCVLLQQPDAFPGPDLVAAPIIAAEAAPVDALPVEVASIGTAVSWRQWLVVAWAAIVTLLLVRLVGGWWQLRRVVRRDSMASVPPRWQAIFDEVSAAVGARAAARLVRTSVVAVPAAVGWLRPVVLMPAGIFTGLSESQIRALIAHELAHIARADYAINIMQSVIETLLFYHPAVWWVSRGIRNERECCCDELAVRLTGDRLEYARALTALESWRGTSPPLVLSTKGGSLMYRIHRLLDAPTGGGAARTAPAAAILVASAAIGVAALGLPAATEAACPPDATPDEVDLTSYELHKLGKGKGKAIRLDGRAGSRYRLVTPDGDGEILIVVSDDAGKVSVRRLAGDNHVSGVMSGKGTGTLLLSDADGRYRVKRLVADNAEAALEVAVLADEMANSIDLAEIAVLADEAVALAEVAELAAVDIAPIAGVTAVELADLEDLTVELAEVGEAVAIATQNLGDLSVSVAGVDGLADMVVVGDLAGITETIAIDPESMVWADPESPGVVWFETGDGKKRRVDVSRRTRDRRAASRSGGTGRARAARDRARSRGRAVGPDRAEGARARGRAGSRRAAPGPRADAIDRGRARSHAGSRRAAPGPRADAIDGASSRRSSSDGDLIRRLDDLERRLDELIRRLDRVLGDETRPESRGRGSRGGGGRGGVMR